MKLNRMLWTPSSDDAEGDLDLDDELEDELEEEELEDEVDEQAESDDEVAELNSRITELRKRLRKVNKESRDRRHTIADLEKQIETLQKSSSDGSQQQQEDLTSEEREELTRLRKRARRFDLSEAISARMSKMNIRFVSDVARQDALGILAEEFEGDDEFEDEDVQAELKSLARTRPYLFQAAREAPDADGKNRGSGEFQIDEDEEKLIASNFNIRT